MHRHDMIRLELSTAFIFQVMKALQIVCQSRTIPSFSAYKGLQVIIQRWHFYPSESPWKMRPKKQGLLPSAAQKRWLHEATCRWKDC